ncbi:MAG: hypothetical protein ACLQRH_05595 [Acidimicrobiales bacterium]
MDRNTVKTTFILTLLMALCVGIRSIWGKAGLIIGLVIGLAFTGGSYWFSDSIAIRAARAVEKGLHEANAAPGRDAPFPAGLCPSQRIAPVRLRRQPG